MEKAKIIISKHFKIGEVTEIFYSSFVEHMGRCVYGGIYDPNNSTADENGFRQDVMSAIEELGVSGIRYPGGNFVSGYNWRDGIGDKSKRTPKLNLAWFQTEPNEVGLDEFMKFAKKTKCSPIMAVNLGTAGAKEAAEVVEYCNLDGNWAVAKERVKNGQRDPYNIKYWCLGNEMDGSWQIGGKTAKEYGVLARETAKMMRWTDSNIKLTVCGSSDTAMPTFPEWDRQVLEETYNYVDFISLHKYYDYPNGDRSKKNDFFGSYVDFEKFISTIISTVEYVKAKSRSNHQVFLSVDEWNVWHKGLCPITQTKWGVSVVREENYYDMFDALVFASMISTMINHADYVKISCLAQLVNVLAPIMTEQDGERIVKQTIFYPYKLASNNMKGTAYKTIVESESFDSCYGTAKKICVSACQNNNILTIMIISFSSEETEVDLELEHFTSCVPIDVTTMKTDDPNEYNTFDEPYKVISKESKLNEKTVTIAPYSVNFLRYEV